MIARAKTTTTTIPQTKNNSNMLEDRYNVDISRFHTIGLLFIALLLGHLFACFFVFCSGDPFDEDSRFLSSWQLEAGVLNESVDVIYLTAFYWAMARFVCLCFVLFGGLLLLLLLSSFLLSSSSSSSSLLLVVVCCCCRRCCCLRRHRRCRRRRRRRCWWCFRRCCVLCSAPFFFACVYRHHHRHRHHQRHRHHPYLYAVSTSSFPPCANAASSLPLPLPLRHIKNLPRPRFALPLPLASPS
jgi:hypothetical protein